MSRRSPHRSGNTRDDARSRGIANPLNLLDNAIARSISWTTSSVSTACVVSQYESSAESFLQDSATQMVEVIWPLSIVPCQAEGGNGRGVLPLRTYIEETLRRSRTSYSTLQVALYYLVLIMPQIPKNDFTMEQFSDCPASRALMCGRRMFLSALILASKYLQDRNYSAKAWSKMSGLKISEINSNERTFLERVSWKLHIPKPKFEKWQELVLRYTPRPACANGTGASTMLTWREIVPRLTSDLDTVPMPSDAPKVAPPEASAFLGMASPATTPTPTKSAANPFGFGSSSQETTPTPTTMLPRFLEPKTDLLPPTPALIRMGPLPTPQMTPTTLATNTPAASVCGSRRPSMCSAMAQAQKASLSRCALDAFANADFRHVLSRRPSLMSTASSMSSPESMYSDRPRPSRSSSISSVSVGSTSSSMAPQRACLARQATCRNVRLTLPAMVREVTEEGTSTKPIVIDDDIEMTASPEYADFSVSEKVARAPHRHSKHAPHAKPVAATRKRCRSYGHGRNDADEEISFQLQDYHAEEMEVDDHVAPYSDAVSYTRSLLSSRASSEEDTSYIHAMPTHKSPSPLSNRIAVRNHRGNKRSCVPADAMFATTHAHHIYSEIA